MTEVILIAHNLRSAHNVGSLLRTADGLGVKRVYLTGYTPYPLAKNDDRIPHIANKIHKAISKTALGAEDNGNWDHFDEVEPLLDMLKSEKWTIAALEQAPNSVKLPRYHPPKKIAIIVGREVEGIEPELLRQCDITLELPMHGTKESYNVAQAAAMSLYHVVYFSSVSSLAK